MVHRCSRRQNDQRCETVGAGQGRQSKSDVECGSVSFRWLCVMLYPVMPAATREIWQQLNLSEELAQMDPAKLKWGELKEETPNGAVKPVFPRLDKTKIMEEIQRNTEDLSQKPEETQVSALS